MQHDQYCREKVATPGSNHYYSLLYTPKEKISDITAIYAFREEIFLSVLQCSDPDIAHTKLNWWREELERCFNKKPQHPVSHALQPSIQTCGLSIEYFKEMLNGAQMRLEHDIYSHFDPMKIDCYRLGGTTSLLVTEILGYKNRSTQRFAEDLGIGLQLTQNIHNLRLNRMHGNICIPLDEMQTHNIQTEDVFEKKTSPNMASLLKMQCLRARKYFKQAAMHLTPDERGSQIPSIILGNLHIALLDTIESDGCRLAEHQVDITPLRKFWIAWRTQFSPSRHMFQ